MSKKKRLRRDVEKLFRTGRYWELLRLLEQESVAADFAGEHREAWQVLIKQALKNARAFEEFLKEIEGLGSFPGNPDLRFLLLLKDCIDDGARVDELLQVKGLSPDAERLRAKVPSFASIHGSPAKLQSLLEKFQREPGKITRRYYDDLASLLPTPSLATAAIRLGERIHVVRGLNHKAAAARGWAGFPHGRLEDLDGAVATISEALPPPLRDLMIHPFVHNLAVACRRLAPSAKISEASSLVRSIPFLIQRLAGEKMDDVRKLLLTQDGEWVEEAHGEAAALRQTLKGMPIEEKVALLGALRSRSQSSPDQGPELDFPDFFDDGDDEEDYPGDDSIDRGEHLARSLLLTHGSLLRDIAGRMPGLSSRERKDLARVMEPVLFQDLDFIADHGEHFDEIMDLMGAALEAGCAGTRMGLLLMLASGAYRRGDLRGKAEKHLDRLDPPTLEDMQWLAREWSSLFYPKARALRPLLLRYGNDRSLTDPFAIRLYKLAEGDFVNSTWQKGGLPFPFAFLGGLLAPKPKEPGILRQELEDLWEFDGLDLTRHFLRCYPKDRLTVEGNLCWLNALHSMQPGGAWGWASQGLKRWRRFNDEAGFLLGQNEADKIFADKLRAAMLFVKEHMDELCALPMDEVNPLLEQLLEYPAIYRDHQAVLVHIHNQLGGRLAAGDDALRPLMDKMKNVLLEPSKPGRKPAKPRKKRR